MIIEKYTVQIEREKRISDYCVGCERYEPEENEYSISPDGRERFVFETCVHGNACDELYARLKGKSFE